MDIVAILTGLAGLFGAVIALAWGAYLDRASSRQKGETLETRADLLTASLGDAVRLIGEVQDEIETRQQLIEKLEMDAKTYRQIAQLKQPEVEAKAQFLREELKKATGRSPRQVLAINCLFFLSGAGVAVAATLYAT